jgi:hypothetical protein
MNLLNQFYNHITSLQLILIKQVPRTCLIKIEILNVYMAHMLETNKIQSK